MTKQKSLERKMLTYFGLIAAASLMITIEFIIATKGLTSLRNKAVLMCAVQAVVTLIVLIMFMRRITSPLQHMVSVSSLISQGDLSQTIRINSNDEIGLVGDTINELTSNIQEIVAYGLATQSDLRSSIEEVRLNLDDSKETNKTLDDMEARLDDFASLMSSFTLLSPPTSPESEPSSP